MKVIRDIDQAAPHLAVNDSELYPNEDADDDDGGQMSRLASPDDVYTALPDGKRKENE